MQRPAAPAPDVDIAWPRVVWSDAIGVGAPINGVTGRRSKSRPAAAAAVAADDDDDDDRRRGVIGYWRVVTRDVDARTVVLPYALGAVAALFVVYVALRVPNAPRSKLKQHDDP